jgi:hypothetical protein
MRFFAIAQNDLLLCTLFFPLSPLFLICHPEALAEVLLDVQALLKSFFTCHPEAKPKGLL